MTFWDIVFILFGTVLAQIFIKDKKMTAPFMDFVKSNLSWSESALANLEEIIMPLLGLVFTLFFVHPQDVMAQITSGAAWNVSINAILGDITKSNG